MPIAIPDFLQQKLGDQRTPCPYRGAVLTAVQQWGVWADNSHVPFFRQYTDHGPQHITDVLGTACELMTPASQDLLSANDAAALILATLLHDSAMHLLPAGFLRVVRGQYQAAPFLPLDHKSWPQLWEDFKSEVSRFGDSDLERLFGHTTRVLVPNLDSPQDWTQDQHDLLGEFIRRHHPRLAHEIAIMGVPDANSTPALRLDGVPEDIRDLVGLIARSHGLPVRTCAVDLQTRFNRRDYQGIHAVYLMTLLRVADYLKIEPGRAPEQMFKMQPPRSLISRREWKVHHAIRNISYQHQDPEAVEIQLFPDRTDLATFLRLREWFSGVQSELDISWAILGETYGESYRTSARGNLSQFGLRLRRVRSDLDDMTTFSRHLSYIPVRARFETNGGPLLRLLVGPLYGYSPAAGLREAIQNAVDAVRELNAYAENHTDDPSIVARLEERIPQACDVEVSVVENSDGTIITVSDRGIGMTADTVLNYFLRAGSSFRDSDAWKQEFEHTTGSRVLRSGRFGIGALALFLLGDQIEVATRHIGSPKSEGISFSATLEQDAISLFKRELPVGTTIRIISKDAAARFAKDIIKNAAAWDWYVAATPSVSRSVNGVPLARNILVPELASDVDPAWRRISPPGFNAVHWTVKDAPRVVCNGLIVAPDPQLESYQGHISLYDRPSYAVSRSKDWPSGLYMPAISVFDSAARLPLTLHRSSVAGRLPFEADLLTDVLVDLLAFASLKAPEDPVSLVSSKLLGDHPLVGGSFEGVFVQCAVSASGWVPLTRVALERLGVRQLFVTRHVQDPSTWDQVFAAMPGWIIVEALRYTTWNYSDQTRARAWLRMADGSNLTGSEELQGRILVYDETAVSLQLPGVVARRLRERLVEERKLGDKVLLRLGNPESTQVNWEALSQALDKENPRKGILAAEWQYDSSILRASGEARSAIGVAWDVCCTSKLFPWKVADRGVICRNSDSADRFRQLRSSWESILRDPLLRRTILRKHNIAESDGIDSP